MRARNGPNRFTSTLSRHIVPALTLALVLGGANAAFAIDNPSFETGDLTDWQQGGVASVVDDTVGVTPTHGDWHALIESGSGLSPADLASFLDVTEADINSLTTVGGNVTQGSAIAQEIAIAQGHWVQFDWNFLTNEAPNEDPYNDFSFVSLTDTSDGSLVEISLLGDTWSGLSSSSTTFSRETGYRSFSTAPLAATGVYRLGFGVVDVGDTAFNSGLLVDNVTIAIPSPAAVGPGLALLGMLGLTRSRRQRDA